MAHFTELYVHCVWATWNRLPLITSAAESRVYGAIRTKCEELGCPVIAIGGVADHVHLLVQFSTTISMSHLIGEVKGASSHVMTHIVAPGSFFKWQGSYGVFTISKRSIADVEAYIRNQKQRHAQNKLIPELETCAKS